MFKVGDKVKIIGNGSGEIIHYLHIGETVTIERVRGSKLEVGGRIFQTVSKLDVELIIDSPVRETTIVKKEIIPGDYDLVVVQSNGYVSMSSTKNKERLAKAIKTLQIIHDAME